MRPRIYIETSIISYLAALPSRDLIVAAHQQIVHEWWMERRESYELFVSELVIREAQNGDSNAALRRLNLLQGLPILIIDQRVQLLANIILKEGCLPIKAGEDAVHIALASVHTMDYLLTWNCKHIANAHMRQKIVDICRRHGFKAPVIGTPEDLSEE